MCVIVCVLVLIILTTIDMSRVARPPSPFRHARRALRLTAHPHGFACPFAQRAAVICTNPLDRDACPASALSRAIPCRPSGRVVCCNPIRLISLGRYRQPPATQAVQERRGPLPPLALRAWVGGCSSVESSSTFQSASYSRARVVSRVRLLIVCTIIREVKFMSVVRPRDRRTRVRVQVATENCELSLLPC